jgi:pimeloyl-ACP methyl ester carboxylesterase
MTLPTIEFAGPSEAPDRILLILLPGADMTAQDFVDYDFISPVQRTAEAIDVLCVDSSVDLYLDNTIVDELHRLILVASPPRRKLWLAGISLGGMGALLYARAHPGTVEGIILLSPYLGARGIVDEVETSGGLDRWSSAPDEDQSPDRVFLRWLAEACHDPAKPSLHLGYGTGDRFVGAHKMLARSLPAARVTAREGGHDWPTWQALWRDIIQGDPFGVTR